MVTTRCGTPIWIAAKPMPGAAYMVSNMSATRRRISSSTSWTGLETSRRVGSGSLRISRKAMRGDVRRGPETVNAIGGPIRCSPFVRADARISYNGTMLETLFTLGDVAVTVGQALTACAASALLVLLALAVVLTRATGERRR